MCENKKSKKSKKLEKFDSEKTNQGVMIR